jgi:acetyl-CoA carboxylase biotin carboxylase subunit
MGQIQLTPIRKLLVANRGEIALRIFRTAREMGISTVAVYSDADVRAPFARYADEAVHIGPAPAAQSYLSIDRVIDAALRTGADAIHPGYGFLSENAEFARAVKAAGLIFVGPGAEAMEVMGSKLAAKAAAAEAGVPLVPGSAGAVADVAEARAAAERIGFPLLVKASAGGGGKGMRLVHDPTELDEQFERAVSEATNAFGDGSVFLEKFATRPRHIEIQILADQHGNCVHLFERECSIQRRHQKVVEEAPSAVLTPELRAEMGACAVRLSQACGYVGAGTVEFVLDADMHFFFLEMNTRLQVEHPVTECITGVDLVREQLRIAEGHPLPWSQEELRIGGHAIELRVYAEDTAAGFLPSTGTLTHYLAPTGPGVRVDDGVEAGQEIPIYYDPMLAKLVVHAPDREAAIARLLRAIDEYAIGGVSTTLDFGRFAVDHPAFRSGQFDTHFVRDHYVPEALHRSSTEALDVLSLLATGASSGSSSFADRPVRSPRSSGWVARNAV